MTPAPLASSAHLRSEDRKHTGISYHSTTSQYCNSPRQTEIPGREEGRWGQMWLHWLCLLLSNTAKQREKVLLAQQQIDNFTFVDFSDVHSLTFILSYTEAAFSGSLLWCRKANSVSTIPGDIHCRAGKWMTNVLFTYRVMVSTNMKTSKWKLLKIPHIQ